MKQVFVTTAFAIASAALVFGCASETTGPSSETGNVGVNLLVGDNDVTAVNFEVTCSDSTVCPLNGQFNVIDRGPNEPPIWATIMDLPVGDPDPIVYTINLTALDDQGVVLCTGSDDFTVNALEPTKVNVVLECGGDGEELLGSVDIDATFVIIDGNRCPRLHFLNAVPIDVPAGGSEVTVLVSDADEDPLTTALTTPGGGSFADPAAQSTTYFCDNASGAQTISVTVSDGVEACNKSKSFDVVCPGVVDPCDGKDCDAGNLCVAAECNEATGDCVTSNVDSGVGCALGELTTNGGFELGNLDFWTLFCDSGSCVETGLEANGGSFSGRVSATSANGPANPLIKQANIGVGLVEPNSPVTVSVDIKGTAANGGVVFAEFFSEVLPSGTSKNEFVANAVEPTETWTTYTLETTTGADVTNGVTLQLVAVCGAVPGCTVDAFFDNASVVFGSGAGTCDGQGTCTGAGGAGGTGGSAGTGGSGGAGGMGGSGGPVVLYEQSFDGLPVPAESIFITDDWKYFNFVFDSNGDARFDYDGPAPNGPQICALVDEGGAEQGTKQLTVYSDYNCCGGPFGHQLSGDSVQVNVFRELTITAADLNKTLEFSFDAKRGNINDPNAPLGICDPPDPGYTINPPCDSTALAFVKTIDSGGNLTNERVIDTTNLPVDWTRVTVPSLDLTDPALEGQTLQVGFQTTAESFEPSGNFYDNVLVTVE